jgi:hypothetical protein
MVFLTDVEAAAYGQFDGAPSKLELERYFFPDDEDKALIAQRRGDHNWLGFALQRRRSANARPCRSRPGPGGQLTGAPTVSWQYMTGL